MSTDSVIVRGRVTVASPYESDPVVIATGFSIATPESAFIADSPIGPYAETLNIYVLPAVNEVKSYEVEAVTPASS